MEHGALSVRESPTWHPVCFARAGLERQRQFWKFPSGGPHDLGHHDRANQAVQVERLLRDLQAVDIVAAADYRRFSEQCLQREREVVRAG